MSRYAQSLIPLLFTFVHACAPTPSWYGVPAQHKPPADNSAPAATAIPGLGEFMCSAQDGAEQYIVKDIKGAESDWRWTLAEPEFRFQLKPENVARRFHLELGINDNTFKQTGPLKLVFEVNGREFARETFNTFGDHTWEKRVEPGLLIPGAENRVKIRVLNPWQAPDPGVKLGFVLKCAGFQNQ